MIYVSIAGERRRLDEVDSYWIHQQVGGRRDEEQSACVQVEFDDPSGKWGSSLMAAVVVAGVNSTRTLSSGRSSSFGRSTG